METGYRMSRALENIGWSLYNFCKTNNLLLVKELKFHPTRRWRFDWAIPEKKWAVEFNGGVFMNKSGHSNAAGQTRDQEKMNQAQILGWKVLSYNAKNWETITEDLKSLL